MNMRWRIIGKLTTTSPLHVGSGELANHDLIRDKDDKHCDVQAVVKTYGDEPKPCIPGTALKGVLRAWAEQMLPGEKQPLNSIFGASDIGDKKTEAEKIGAKKAEAGWAEFCTAMIVPPSEEVKNRFEQTVPYWQPESLTGIFSHVCIDRQTGTAEHNKLYYEEFVPEGVSFQVEIDAQRLTEAEVSLLLAVLEKGVGHTTHPCQFGANGANGWGRMTWELGKVTQLDAEAIILGPDQVGFDCCTKLVTVSPTELSDLSVPAHISANLLLTCDGPFLVNDASRAKRKELSDEENGGRTNFTPLRRGNGDIWLPASSFRGALRERAEFLLRSFNPNSTGDPNQTLGDGPIERIFGKTSQASRLTIQEFDLADQTIQEFDLADHGSVKRQDFVAIDRFTGGAGDGAKFDAQYADRPVFETKLRLDLAGLEPEDIALLALALRDVCQDKVPLGWGGSKGYGQATGILHPESVRGLPSDWDVPNTLLEGTLDDSGRKWLAEQLQKLVKTDGAEASDTIEPSVAANTAQPIEPDRSDCKLTVRQLNGRFEYEVTFHRRGKLKHLKVHEESQIAPDLRGKPAENIKVDFEMYGSAATRVRPRGEPWVAAPPVKKNTFAHPYYFLRMEDRESFTGELADAPPVGHRRLVPGRYSGTIHVKLTTKTPLLICDDREETIEVSDNGHKTYQLRLRDGKPDLASSSVRGMLRSAYEAVTNSRFGVFPGKPTIGDKNAEKHGKRLGFRLPANRGLNTVPARIVPSTSSATGLALELLPGSSGITPSGTKAAGAPIFGAWCGMYGGWRPTGLAGLSHRAEAWAYLTPWHYRRELQNGHVIEFDFWNVEEMRAVSAKPTTPPSTALRPAFGSAEPASWSTPDWYRGFLCVSLRNMTGKHDERFFFSSASTAPIPAIPVKNEHLHQWRQLIENYQIQNERDLMNGRVCPPVLPGYCVYSRHITTAPPTVSLAERQLQQNDLCYAEVVYGGGSWILKALYPVIISRKLYDKSPLDCLPAKLRPANLLKELSPADRVFGWVNQDEETASGQENEAYRSHIRLGTVTCTTDANMAIEEFETPKTLAILGQPKPQQGRFYLGDRQGKTQANGLTKEQAGYNETNRIRGPKIYPHHAQGINESNACSNDASKQNRSVQSWVRPGTAFAFDLHVTNLSSVELGALVWLLSLPKDHFLRLGLGKPLGFGSVYAEIDADKTLVAESAAWIKSWSQWEAIPDTLDLASTVGPFTQAINAANPKLLDSFQKAAAGFDELPIHYPRLAGQGPLQGDHFRWFVENERGNQHRVLPDLFEEDVSLPLL
jgi:CRISPR-associated protein (TIGR03986 family)